MIRAAALAAAFVALAAAAHAQATDAPLDRAARALAASRSIRSGFEQTLTNPDIKQVRTSRGDFAQQGASKFAFRFTDPSGDAIVSDGTAIWVYLPSSARGQVLKLPIAQGAQLDLLTQLLGSPRQTYKVSDGAAESMGGRAVATYTLVPRNANAPFTQARLWIDQEDALVRQLEVVELSGLQRRIRFTNLQVDAELPAGMLTFAVPQGVKVLDASALVNGLKPPAPRP